MMPDRHTIRVFVSGMGCMSMLCFLAMGGAFVYDRLTYDHSKDAAFEAEMAEHRAFLEEHVRRREEHQRQMDAEQRAWETRRQVREAHEEVPRVEKTPCP